MHFKQFELELEEEKGNNQLNASFEEQRTTELDLREVK